MHVALDRIGRADREGDHVVTEAVQTRDLIAFVSL
jgi:hypothetical protein